MNIFTAAVTGLTIVIKKIGIGFKDVMTGLKIAIISVIDFIASVITAIVNAIVSAIKWVVTQIVNFIHLLFRTYLRLEAGCVPPVQKFVGLMIRLRWGFVILSGLYAVYQYFGITALLVAIAVCGGLVAIGYSEAEKEEEWNSTFDWVNRVIVKYLKYLIRLVVMIASVCSLHLMLHNKIVTFSAAALLAAVVLYMLLQFRKKDDKKCENAQLRGFIEETYEPSRMVHPAEEKKVSAKPIFTTILMIYLILFCCVVIGSLICNAFNFHAS
ncbi:MAG: hypothetical protein ACTFAL_00790 [Candidatus Electronema sp. V4]|uniref:hypothetical protein n=1 Tax=Candidatus Electronema sp. V4 TaxID=3454756 RepID=UPI0040554F99